MFAAHWWKTFASICPLKRADVPSLTVHYSVCLLHCGVPCVIKSCEWYNGFQVGCPKVFIGSASGCMHFEHGLENPGISYWFRESWNQSLV